MLKALLLGELPLAGERATVSRETIKVKVAF